MAIAFDAVAGSGNNGGTLTFNSAATGSLSNGMAVLVCFNNGHPLTATWGGVAMTSMLDTGNEQIFILPSPASGVQSIVVSGGVGAVIAYGLTYSGVSPNIALDANAGSAYATAGTGNITQSNTTVHDNCWNIMFVVSNVYYSASTGVTIRQKNQSVSSLFFSVGDSNSAKTPAGAYSMTMTRDGGGTGNAGWRVFSLQPFLTPPAAPLFTINVNGLRNAFQQAMFNLRASLPTITMPRWSNASKPTTTWTNAPKP